MENTASRFVETEASLYIKPLTKKTAQSALKQAKGKVNDKASQ